MNPKKRSNFKAHYMKGSVATKIATQPKIEKEVSQNKRKKQKENKHYLQTFFYNLVTGISLFVPCLFLIIAFSSVAKSNYEIQSLQNQINEVKMENDKIRMEFVEETAPETVKKIAIERLGMQMPEPYQLVEINVPKTDYSVLDEE